MFVNEHRLDAIEARPVSIGQSIRARRFDERARRRESQKAMTAFQSLKRFQEQGRCLDVEFNELLTAVGGIR